MSNKRTSLASWKALEKLASQASKLKMLDIFRSNPNRFKDFSVRTDGILFDYSKQNITSDIMHALLDFAKDCDVEGMRDKMFSGHPINTTENRAVLHTALRRPETDFVLVDGENVMPFVHDVLRKMEKFSNAIHSGEWRGFTGEKIRNVIHIGIGGSDLGPRMVCEALKPFHIDDISIHFVANIDGADLSDALKYARPDETLFIIASKTFTTQETMMNAHSARSWIINSLKDEKAVSKHFVALSTNIAEVKKFGISEDAIFAFKDWVGGRYSLWSAIGLPIVLSVGFENFKKLLNGAYTFDRHFLSTPIQMNIPILMALISVWNINFKGARSFAILPYAQNLMHITKYLQQLDMESNGKGTDKDGVHPLPYDTAPVVFGQTGTNGQHAFYQMLHQGTSVIPCDFIGFIHSNHNLPEHHALLLNNMIAQSQALMQGRTLEEAKGNPHRVFEGNRPSTTIILDRLDPHHLGMLIALYEHKIFIQGVLWNINSFDQFGVELGKELAQSIEKGSGPMLDSSTRGLLDYIQGK